jgi:hypothetical protein
MVAATKFRQKPDLSTGPKFLGIRSTKGERKNYENRDNDSNNCDGITVYGARPDNGGAATDAGADEGHADYCSGEGEENASRSGAEQTAGKT